MLLVSIWIRFNRLTTRPEAGLREAAHLTLSYAQEAANPLYRSDTASFFDYSLSCAVGAFSKAVERLPAPHRIDAAYPTPFAF